MYELTLLMFTAAACASGYLIVDAYKHRFLPIAKPLMYLSATLTLLCVINIIEMLPITRQQFLGQVLFDLRAFLVRPICLLLWTWVLLEFHHDKKVAFSNKILLFCLIIPLLTTLAYISHIYTDGFLSQVSTTALISPDERGGGLIIWVRGIGALVILGAIVSTPYIMIKRRLSGNYWLVVSLVILMTLLPYVFYQLHRMGITQSAYAALPMVFLLFLGSRQYRLLDALPIALQRVMDKVDSGILVSSVDAKLLYINNFAQQLFGLNVSANVLEGRQKSIPDVFEQHFDFSLAKKQTALIQTKTDAGHTRYIDSVLQPIFHSSLDKHLGATLSLHDITERRQAELELAGFNRQKSEFFAGISHEFRTPLTLSMGGIDDVLSDTNAITPAQRDTLIQVKRNNQRLLSLVNQLLELSRLDTGSLRIRPVQIRLDDFVPMVIAKFASQAARQQVTIHSAMSEQVRQDSIIYFDPDALDKILVNLISNALKSIHQQTRAAVYVDVYRAGDAWLQLSVRDTGCGIPLRAQSKIFELFYSHQMDNPAWPPGTGVGLSLVKQLLLLHGGDIRVSSTEGEGTCFSVDLQRGYAHFAKDTPIDFTHEWALAPSLALESHQETIDANNEMPITADEDGRKRILLAEDHPDFRRYMRKHLLDYQVIEVADGQAALEQALAMMPDLILSDVMMPKINGYDLCFKLKSNEKTSHIPIILLTAKSHQSEKLEGLSLGADDYLSKPFDVRELNLRINNLISARKKLQEFYQVNGFKKAISHPGLPEKETQFLQKIQKYVHANIGNSEIKITDLAELVHMSERSLSRKVKALTGDTPKKMLLTIRLERAAKLLLDTTETITQLSYRVGFSDASHFARTFKAHYAMTPSEYRDQRQLISSP